LAYEALVDLVKENEAGGDGRGSDNDNDAGENLEAESQKSGEYDLVAVPVLDDFDGTHQSPSRPPTLQPPHQ
jgi:hypothetical protein